MGSANSSKSLDLLLSRTLTSSAVSKKKSKRTHQKRNRKSQAKSQNQNLETISKLKQKPKPKSDAENYEIDILKEEIANKLSEKVVWSKKARIERSFSGLTPGLAPIGYDPDESDEEPY